MRREMIDDELPQILGVGGGYPHEVVGHAGQVEHHQHARQLADGIGEGVDLLTRVNGEPNRDERLERSAESGEVDLGAEATDHPPLAQRAQPCQGGRGRHTDAVGEALCSGRRLRGSAASGNRRSR